MGKKWFSRGRAPDERALIVHVQHSILLSREWFFWDINLQRISSISKEARQRNESFDFTLAMLVRAQEVAAHIAPAAENEPDSHFVIIILARFHFSASRDGPTSTRPARPRHSVKSDLRPHPRRAEAQE